MNPIRHYEQSYPAFLDLQDRQILLVGGGKVALRKLKRLADSGAQITVVAPTLTAELETLQKKLQCTHYARDVQDKDFKSVTLVFAACDQREQNLMIARQSHKAGVFVNVADVPSASSFLVPSLIDRKPLLVAVSSTGASPVLARLLTARIDAFLPHTYKQLGELAIAYRQRIAELIPDAHQRRHFWEKLLSGRVGELILQGRSDTASSAIEAALTQHDAVKFEGEVYMVGAGPGDPDLLTFRALRLMQQCDVVLYDRLVSESIMALVNKDAERIYVGKQRHNHAVPQDSINQQLVEFALQGKRVLRLKGGDPFMFGRGGEEIETLSAKGVDFQIVPGITAAMGCACYAGIPLTHRDYAQACLFVTGHLKDGSINLDWQALTRPQQTVVIYMGLVGLPVICRKLIENGLPADHPIAIVAQGTRADQKVLTGTLHSLPAIVQAESVKPPTLIIIGQVVNLRDKLSWFESRA